MRLVILLNVYSVTRKKLKFDDYIMYVVSVERRWFIQQNRHGNRFEKILVGMVHGEDRGYKQQVL